MDDEIGARGACDAGDLIEHRVEVAISRSPPDVAAEMPVRRMQQAHQRTSPYGVERDRYEQALPEYQKASELNPTDELFATVMELAPEVSNNWKGKD